MPLCRTCNEEYPLDSFAIMRHRRLAPGQKWSVFFVKHCTSCRVRSNRTRPAAAKKAKIVEQAKAVPCADCGGTFPACSMDFDHRPGEGKTFNIGVSARTVSEEQLRAEIAKCDVVCANCHRVRTAFRGYSKGRPKGLPVPRDYAALAKELSPGELEWAGLAFSSGAGQGSVETQSQEPKSEGEERGLAA